MNINDPTSPTADYGASNYEASPYGGTSDYLHDMDDTVRQNPVAAVLIALGIGLLIGAAIRALQPQKPRNRVAEMLGDIQDQLQQLSKPVYKRAAQAAETGTDFVRGGVDRLSDLHVERKLRSWSKRLRNLLP